jgi:hypothetical protein
MTTVTINGKDYELGSIKAGVGRKLKAKYPDESDFGVAFLAESLKAGGFSEATPEWVDENLNYFDGQLNEAQIKAYQANGIKTEVKPKMGEARPPVEAAAA